MWSRRVLSSVSKSIAGASSFVHWSRRARNAVRTTVPEGRCWGNATGERGARPPLVGTIFISSKHPRPTPTLPSNWIIGNHVDAHCPRVPTHSEVCRQTTAKLHQYILRYNAPRPRRFFDDNAFSYRNRRQPHKVSRSERTKPNCRKSVPKSNHRSVSVPYRTDYTTEFENYFTTL